MPHAVRSLARWQMLIALALSAGGLATAVAADPAAALAERGAHLTRDPAGNVIDVRFEKPLAEGDLADLAKLPKLTSLSLHGPDRTADLVKLKTLPALKSLFVFQTEDHVAGWQAIAVLKNLESLVWFGGVVSDDRLAALAPLTNLRELSIARADEITDEGLAHLKAHPHLRKLFLSNSKITGEKLSHLHGHKALESLSLHGAHLTDEGLAGLKGLSQLRELQIGGWGQVGDAGLKHVAELTRLKKLDLANSKISGAGLIHLKGLTELEHLNLAHTKVTDPGLLHLRPLEKLNTVVLAHSAATQGGVAELRAKMPNLAHTWGVETLALKGAATEKTTPPKPANASQQRRWAIVPLQPAVAGLADLVTAELTRRGSVELVEREQIAKVLAEQTLQASGLVPLEEATRLGNLLKADALLLLDELKPIQGRKALRVRLVESVTGIKLLDEVLPTANLDRQVPEIVAELDRARKKLAVPETERRYLGVVAIQSEEPGESLAGTCRTLAALVESRLQQLPKFVVLERESLGRLTDESKLTGSELRLRGSAWLLEAGVRQREGGGLIVTCRLARPGQTGSQTLRVEVASGNLIDVRNQLVAEVEKNIGLDRTETGDAEAADEAVFFALRRDRSRAAYDLKQTVEMAEAALILAPNPQNLRETLGAYNLLAHQNHSANQSKEALLAAHRHHVIVLEWLRKTAVDDPLRQALPRHPFQPHVPFPTTPESEEVTRLRDATDRLSLEHFDLRLQEARLSTEPPPPVPVGPIVIPTDPQLVLLLRRLEFARYLSKSAREYTVELPQRIEQILHRLEEIKATKSPPDENYSSFARLLLGAEGWILTSRHSMQQAAEPSQQELKEIAGIWAQLAQHDDPVVRAVGLSALTAQPGRDGEIAAAALMDSLRNLPPVTSSWGQPTRNVYEGLVERALQRLPPERTQKFFEELIASAEQTSDAALLLQNARTLQSFVGRAKPPQRQEWTRRILAVLDSYSQSLAAKDAAERKDRLQVTPAQLEAREIAAFRSSLAVRPSILQPEAPRPFSVAHGEGPWKEYVTRSITIEAKPQDRFTLRDLWVDRSEDAARRGGELVLVVARRQQNTAERVSRSGGLPVKFGTEFPGLPKSFRGMQVAYGGGAMYVASDAPGFFRLQADAMEAIDQKAGAPASEVHQLAWYKDRLYVAYRDALASYDPATKKFAVIAASGTLEPRNSLDGRGSFFVNSLVADESHGCLWLHVQDNALPRSRNGFWRYEPDANKFTQITKSRVSWSWADEGILLNVEGDPPQWALVDRAGGKLTKLEGYKPWSPPLEGRFTWPRITKVGEHLITEAGQLYTPDGQVHQVKTDVPWEKFEWIGPGFLTHFDPATNRLWCVEPPPKSEPPVK